MLWQSEPSTSISPRSIFTAFRFVLQFKKNNALHCIFTPCARNDCNASLFVKRQVALNVCQ